MLTFPLSFKHNYRHHTTKAKTKLSGAPANDLLFLFISAHVIPQMISTKIHTEASRDTICLDVFEEQSKTSSRFQHKGHAIWDRDKCKSSFIR